MHDATAVLAMYEVKQMAQFVDPNLCRTLQCRYSTKPVHRDHGVFSTFPGFAENMGEDRHEKIHVQNADDLFVIMDERGFQGRENDSGVILLPL